MTTQPLYLLFAGVNGAGKTTLFKSGLWHRGEIDPTMPRVNSDEILAENGWDWRSERDQLKAGRIAVKRIRQHLERRESFNQETTLAGKAIMRTIRQAHDEGYRIVMHYVCVSDPRIANERIAQRGAIGGHVIDPETVSKRYDSSLANLAKAIHLCSETYLHDNTIAFELEARFEFGRPAFFNPAEPHLAWVARVMDALGYAGIDF